MKNAGRAARYFEQTFNYTPPRNLAAKKQTGHLQAKSQ
jgi:hypothetical protein